jgi:peptide/nickel transport system substrate-binding protein
MLVSILVVVPNLTLVMPQVLPRERTLYVDIDGGRVADPTNWNWLIPGSRRDQGYHQLVMEMLFYIDFETGEFIPWLAESYEYRNNFTTFVIHLRKGITWSDGVPFTADDVVFTYETLLKNAPKLAYSAMATDWIKSVRKVDDYTVELTLNRQNPRFHILPIASTCPVWGGLDILPKHIWKDKDVLTFKFYPPIGTGPYTLVDASETTFVYKRRDDWWATKVFGIRPAPEYIVFVWYGTEDIRAMRMAQHQLDSICDITPGTFLSIKAKNPYVEAWHSDVPYAWLDPCPRYLSIPWTKYPWNIPEVRRAISYLINREELIRVAYENSSVPTWGPFPFYGGLTPYADYIRDLIQKYDWVTTYDPQKAEAIFKGLGFKKGADGIWVTPNGTRLELTIIAPSPWIEILRNAIITASQLKAGGIDAVVKTLEVGPFFDAIDTGQYDAASYWAGQPPDPLTTLDLWNSKFYVPVGQTASSNPERYKNPEFDKILNEWEITPPSDLDKCKDLFRKAMDIWFKDLPYGVPLAQARKLIPFDTYYWTGWPTADNPWIHPPNWWASFLLVIVGYKSPTTGNWIGGIKPSRIEYTTVYFTNDTPQFRGIDLIWYGPFKAGMAARIPADDAEFWIRRGYASYTPSMPAVPLEVSKELSNLSQNVSSLSNRVSAIESKISTIMNISMLTIVLVIAVVVMEVLVLMRKPSKSG